MKSNMSNEKTPPSKIALTVSFATDACALFYHICIFFVFWGLKVYPMVFYNIISISVFTLILFLLKLKKSVIALFTLGVVEVIVHQVLAEYFIGSESSFHFFIFMMGLLPYLVFDYRFKVSIPITAITSIIFVILEIYNFDPVYSISDRAIFILRYLNISVTIFIIINTILLFTIIVSKSEKNLTTQNNMLESEIKRAAVIQQAFFRQNLSGLRGWNISFYTKPMAGVSGDFFDFYRSENKLDGFGIFDVSGHGISSGLITMLVKNIIHQEFYAKKDLELWEILNSINDRIVEEKGEVENYLTGILVRFYSKEAEMVIAGHPTPLIFRKSTGECDYLKKTSDSTGAIGIAGFPTYYISQFVDFEEGDRLLFFSDGVLEAIDERKEAFGHLRLLRAFQESVDLDVDTQMEYIKDVVSEFRGSCAQNDDISLICIGR